MNKNDKQFTVQRIREQYVEKEPSELDELCRLDRKVKRPANIFAFVFGSLAAIIMGAGMSLVMTDIGATLGVGNAMVTGIIIGVIGMIMALVNYPIYNKIHELRKKEFAPRILEISEKIMNA